MDRTAFDEFVDEQTADRERVAADEQSGPDCLITTPTLASLEWTARSEPLQVSAQALERVRVLIADPPGPGPASRAAAARFKKRSRGTSAR